MYFKTPNYSTTKKSESKPNSYRMPPTVWGPRGGRVGVYCTFFHVST